MIVVLKVSTLPLRLSAIDFWTRAECFSWTQQFGFALRCFFQCFCYSNSACFTRYFWLRLINILSSGCITPSNWIFLNCFFCMGFAHLFLLKLRVKDQMRMYFWLLTQLILSRSSVFLELEEIGGVLYTNESEFDVSYSSAAWFIIGEV